MIRDPEHARAAIADEAAEWVIAQRAADLSEADGRALLAWLRTSPRHVEEYLSVRALDRRMTAAVQGLAMPSPEELAADDGDLPGNVVEAVARIGRRGPAMRRALRYRPLAAVAMLAVVTLAIVLWLTRGGAPGALQVYRTTHGEQRIVQLPDGSMMHINTDSAVTVRYTQSERLASIDQGEAFFEVKPQPTRPFRVVADSLSAVAVGTQFDVYRHGAVTAVTVVVGHVAVLTGVPSRARVDAALRVGPGEQVRVVGGTIPATATSVDLRHSVGWLHRQIAFDQQPLATVAAEFNRYVPVPLVIDDPELMAVRVSGVFDPYNTEAFVAFLTTLDGVSVERTPAMIRVHRVRPGTRVR